jgi:hypothetical protein
VAVRLVNELDEFERIRAGVREAARGAWATLRAEHPTERFYYFGLWTTPVAHRPAPTACSVEGLARAVAGYRELGTTVDPDELRWSENDSPYDLHGDDLFSALEPLFEAFGDPYDRPRDVNEALLEAMTGALADLEAEGFFGRGDERDAVVVNVTLPGRDDARSAVASARRLNPPAALERYEADLLADR